MIPDSVRNNGVVYDDLKQGKIFRYLYEWNDNIITYYSSLSAGKYL